MLENGRITYNVELIFPSRSDRDYWSELMDASMKAYNLCSNIVNSNNIKLGLNEIHKATYSILREEFPIIPSQGVIKIYKDVLSAYRSIRSNKHKNAKIATKKHPSMRLDKRLYANLNKTGISLTSVKKNTRCKCTFKLYDKISKLFDKYIPCDPLIFKRDNKFYLSVSFSVPVLALKDEICIGVDLGERRFAVSSDGIIFNDKEYNKRRRQVRYLKRCLRYKGTKSARKHLRKLKHKELYQSDAMCHKIANDIIKSTDASIIVLEDLKNIKQKTKKIKGTNRLNAEHNRRFNQVPLYKLKQILTYKALLNGKRVETVSPFLTSQKDCVTGKQDGKRQNRRYYSSTGKVFDSDWNAAINIASKSKHPFSFAEPLDGSLQTFKAGRMSTGQSYNKSLNFIV